MNRAQRRSEYVPARRHQCRPTARALSSVLLVVLAVSASPAMTAVHASVPAHAAPLAYPRFTGPLFGAAAGQHPVGADFSFTCTVQANADATTVAGNAVAVGAAVTNIDTCGQAYLFVSTPGAGQFQAHAALADDATLAGGNAPEARVFVLGDNGYTSRTVDVTLVKGVAKTITIDLAGAVMVAIGFPNGAHTYVYAMQLSHTARVRHPTPLQGGALVSGGTAIPASQISFDCNAHSTTAPVSVSHLVLPATIEMTSCGVTTVKVPAGSTGMLAARFGAGDVSDYTSVPTVFDVRVLDVAGHLLRKAIGLAFLGGGLQPIWVNLAGGATVTFTADSGEATIELAGLALLPGHYKQHPNPDHNEFGSATGGSVSIVPEAFAFDCNAHPGAADITVDHMPVVRDTFIYGTDCGVASLVMTNAHGSFHALVGVDDATIAQKSGSIKLTVLDQNSHPLYRAAARAASGTSGVAISAPVTGASLVKIEITGSIVVYKLQLTGQATFYDRVFPPSEPPLSIKHGVAVNPLSFNLDCNAAVSTADILLIHAAALEQWSLDGQGCGAASLNTLSLKAPHAIFAGQFALAAADQRLRLGHVTVRTLGPSGKALRSLTLTAREGYGPVPFVISLAGAARLVLSWPDQRVIIFAMSVS